MVVLAENRWLCDAMKSAGYSECVQFDVRSIQSAVELLRTDDLDTLTLLSAANHVVLAESNLQLLALTTPDNELANDRVLWTAELRTAVDLLRARFRIDRPLFLPGVPPRHLVGAVDFEPLRAFLDAHVLPLVRVAPTWCVFERIVTERNDTTYAYMPDNLNLNHHGSYALAAMLHAHFRPEVPWRANQKLPDGMSVETAHYFLSVVQDCSGSHQK